MTIILIGINIWPPYLFPKRLSTGEILKMQDWATFADRVLCLKQGEEDPNARFLSSRLFDQFHPPLNPPETPLNELNRTHGMPHIGQTSLKTFLRAIHQGRDNDSVPLGKALRISPDIYEIRSMVDPMPFPFDQRLFTLETVGLEIGYLVKQAALMATTEQYRSIEKN